MKITLKGLISILFLISVIGCDKVQEGDSTKHLDKARQYVEQNRLQDAVIEYKSIVQIDPENDVAHFELGDTYMKLRQPGKAIRHYKLAAALNTDNAKAQLKIGQMFLRVNALTEARKTVTTVLNQYPDSVDAYHLLAGILVQEKEIKKAITALSKANKIDKNNIKTHLFLARLFEIVGDDDQAETAYINAIRLDSYNRTAYMDLCKLYAKTQKTAQIESVLTHVVMTPGIKFEKYTDLARFYERQRRFDLAEKSYKDAIISAPRSARPRMNMAEYFVRRGNKDQAVAHMEKAMSIKKNHPILMTGLAQIYFQFNMLDQAKKRIDTVLETHRQFTRALDLKGRIMMARNDFVHAIDQFDQVIKFDPNNASAHYYKGVCLKKQGGRDRPGEALRRSAAGFLNDPNSFDKQRIKNHLKDAILLDPDLLAPRLELVELYLQEKNLFQARKQLEKALRLSPSSEKGMALLSGIYILEGDFENAEKICHTLVKRNPDNASGHIRLGLIYNATGRDGPAIASFEKAFALNPLETSILDHMASVYMNKNQYDVTLAMLTRYTPLVSRNGKAVIENIKGNVYMKKEDTKTASEHFEKAIELDPFFFQPQMSLALVYHGSDDILKAEMQYKKVIEINKSYIPAYRALGLIREMADDWRQAEFYYTRILEIDPYDALAANNLAFIFAERGGDLDRAMRLARLAKDKLPEDPNIMDTLGWVYYKKGRYANAIEEFQESLKLKPDNPLACYHMGMALYGSKDIMTAKYYLKKALDLDPDFNGAEDARNLLF
ncbi:tetratricopeptide repeat protein [Desulfobacula sp.]|uniref:tetratricopeptide repeat protein n=1 Tax=Desulfobacula sp. TaxID=2593537 RepID=UPI002603E0F0|nr:tetratricopeptide repeat protein [Desulfobacula sp.]